MDTISSNTPSHISGEPHGACYYRLVGRLIQVTRRRCTECLLDLVEKYSVDIQGRGWRKDRCGCLCSMGCHASKAPHIFCLQQSSPCNSTRVLDDGHGSIEMVLCDCGEYVPTRCVLCRNPGPGPSPCLSCVLCFLSHLVSVYYSEQTCLRRGRNLPSGKYWIRREMQRPTLITIL